MTHAEVEEIRYWMNQGHIQESSAYIEPSDLIQIGPLDI